MSIAHKGVRAIRRAVGATPDTATLNARLDHLTGAMDAQAAALHQLVERMDAGVVVGFRPELDSLASTYAEGMVYLNRTLREIRAELDVLRSGLAQAAGEVQPREGM